VSLSWIQALILGLVQGLTEFFPVSSSAHLKLAKKFLSIPDGEHLLFFDLLCHAGTLLALIFYLRREIWEVLRSPSKIALFSLAIIPLVPAYFLLKPIRIAASDPSYLGYFLIFTSLLLFAACRQKTPAPVKLQTATHCSKSKASDEDRLGTAADNPYSDATQLRSVVGLRQSIIEAERSDGTTHCSKSKASDEDRLGAAAANPYNRKWRDVLCIGGMQALALIPGISRSGSTIAAARFCGWNWVDAARFSFLLAVPTILGGEMLETMKWMKGHTDAVPLSFGCYAAGFAASFGLGMVSVRFIFSIYEKGKVHSFAWYCLGMGLLATMIFRNG